jgi:hypothetical protein
MALLSVANETEPLPSFLSHLRIPAIEAEPPRSVFRGGSAAEVTAVLAGRPVICSVVMLRWSTSSVAEAGTEILGQSSYGEMAQIVWQTSVHGRPKPCH